MDSFRVRERSRLRHAKAMSQVLCSSSHSRLLLCAGRVVQRFGSRRCCIVGGVLATAGWCLSTVATHDWHLLLAWSVLVGLGHSLSLFSAVSLMNLWFSKRLALAHALANTGGAASPFLMGFLAPRLFDAVGWKRAFFTFGSINGALLVCAGLLLTPPMAPEERRDTSGAPKQVPPATVTIRALLGHRRFQLLSLTMLFFGAGSWVSVVHMVRMAMDGGMEEARASRLLLYLAIGSVTLRLPNSYLADRFGRRRAIALVLALLSTVHLACAFSTARASAGFLAFFAFCVGGLNGTVLSTTPSLPAELLPQPFRTLASSAILSPTGFGFLIGPVAAAALLRETSDYASAMGFASGCLGVCSSLMSYLATLPPPTDDAGLQHIRHTPTMAVESRRSPSTGVSTPRQELADDFMCQPISAASAASEDEKQDESGGRDEQASREHRQPCRLEEGADELDDAGAVYPQSPLSMPSNRLPRDRV